MVRMRFYIVPLITSGNWKEEEEIQWVSEYPS